MKGRREEIRRSKRREKRGNKRSGSVLALVIAAGLIMGAAVFCTVESDSAEERALAAKSWEEVEVVIESKLGTGYQAAGQCTGYLYWCLKNAYGLDWGTNSVVKTLENKIISAGVTRVAEGRSGNITSEMKAGDIVIFYDGSTAVHCAILGEGGVIYHATTSSGVTKAYTLKRWMDLPDAQKSCDRYIVYRGLMSTGSLTVLKTSSIEDISKNNDCYSLKGAVYGLYKGDSLVGRLVTDKDGRAVLGDIPFGEYTLKEISPSAGYALDEKEYDINIRQASIVKNVKEVPQSSRIDAIIYKIDAEVHAGWSAANRGQYAATLKDALYSVCYYDGYYGEEVDFENLKPVRSWVFKTDESGQAVLNEKYLVSGDPLYKNSKGDFAIPLGTVEINEMKAPEGYLLDDEKHVVCITSEGTDEDVGNYVVPVHKEKIIRGDVKLIKIKDGTMDRLAAVPFTITSMSTGEVHTVTTDDNGYISTAADWNRHTHDTNGGSNMSGVWFGQAEAINDFAGALPYDTYILDEQPCANNEGLTLINGVKFKVYRNNDTVDLGTITNDENDEESEDVDVTEEECEDEPKTPEVKESIVKSAKSGDESLPETGDDRPLRVFAAFNLMLIAAVISITNIMRNNA